MIKWLCDRDALGDGVQLWVYVGHDVSVVSVGLRELLALGGERPLNLALEPGWSVGSATSLWGEAFG